MVHTRMADIINYYEQFLRPSLINIGLAAGNSMWGVARELARTAPQALAESVPPPVSAVLGARTIWRTR